MIDVHCHLEQPNYEKDRDNIIEKSKKQLKAIITSCAHSKDFDLTLKLVDRFSGFIFSTVGIHPKYVNEISRKEKDVFIERIKEKKDKIVGIGETGLDYYWIRDKRLQEKQKELFIQFISLSKELNLPLIIHARDSYEDTIKILEREDAKLVMMHMFGANQLTKQIIENDWYISMNAIVLKSKRHKKVVRDTPMQRLLLETDSPWLAPEDFGNKRNDSTAVKFIAKKIAEVKKVSFEKVDKVTTENAINLFQLNF